MSRFTDQKGRQWLLDSTTAAIKRVRLATGLRISQIKDGMAADYVEAQADQERLGEVLFAWCGHQHPGMTLDKFLEEVMAGETVADARAAMDEAYLLFFPSRQREAMRTRAAELEAEAMEAMLTPSTPATGSPGS